MAAATAYDATVEAEDDQTDVDVEEVLVEQGFQLWWQQLTASPVTWMAQVFDAAGEALASGVGDDPVEILAGLPSGSSPTIQASGPLSSSDPNQQDRPAVCRGGRRGQPAALERPGRRIEWPQPCVADGPRLSSIASVRSSQRCRLGLVGRKPIMICCNRGITVAYLLRPSRASLGRHVESYGRSDLPRVDVGRSDRTVASPATSPGAPEGSPTL
jgi:hypothetical protein